MDIVELGKRYVALGQALQNPTTTMKELVQLAHACDLRFAFGILPNKQEEQDVQDARDDEAAGD